MVPSVLIFFAVSLSALAFPHQIGVRIVAPPKPTYTGILQIPEPAHYFVAPGPMDIRGPCPALNTLANHGYIPRNGVASFEQIVEATTHAFNMDYDFASGLTALGMLTRGNLYINKLSIGLDTQLIPPLPGEIDGKKTRGLAAHGRIEGDVSMTRQDWAIGDNVNFQPDLFAQLLDIVAQVGNDSDVTGPKSIVNVEALSQFKLKRFQESQSQNPKASLRYHLRRLALSYAETSFTLNLFANGTDGTLSVPTMTSIFRDQRFPSNWHRRSSPGTRDVIETTSRQIFAAHPVLPGSNAPNGTYILDKGFLGLRPCDIYNDIMAYDVPGVLLNTTGVLKDNVDFLLNVILTDIFSQCPVAVPHGAANV